MATVKANITPPVPPPPPTFTIECNAAQAQFFASVAGAMSTVDTRDIFGPTACTEKLYYALSAALNAAGVPYISVKAPGPGLGVKIERNVRPF